MGDFYRNHTELKNSFSDGFQDFITEGVRLENERNRLDKEKENWEIEFSNNKGNYHFEID